jgi:hypothetical protein
MEKNTITKWLIQIDSSNELQITEREVSKFAPINRILDRVGYFNLTSIDVSGKTYMVAYEKEEEYGNKTKILVASIDSAQNKVVDMENDDQENIPEIAKQLMGYHPVIC